MPLRFSVTLPNGYGVPAPAVAEFWALACFRAPQCRQQHSMLYSSFELTRVCKVLRAMHKRCHALIPLQCLGKAAKLQPCRGLVPQGNHVGRLLSQAHAEASS